MTVTPHDIDPARFLEDHLAQASPDLLRDMLTTFINALLSADADAVCGASYRSVSEGRVNRRNGYRHRDFDTRAGTIEVAIPKLRQGSYFPDWLLERRRRAEAALTTVVANCYLLGVSTRRMNTLVQTLGITGLSKSQVSQMAKDLDEQVTQFRTRPLDAGPPSGAGRSRPAVSISATRDRVASTVVPASGAPKVSSRTAAMASTVVGAAVRRNTAVASGDSRTIWPSRSRTRDSPSTSRTSSASDRTFRVMSCPR